MITQTVSRSTVCPDCEREGTQRATQALVEDSLRWDVQFECVSHQHAEHTGGLGAGPEWLHEALLAEYGAWVLRIDEGGGTSESPARYMRLLRAALHVSLAEAKARLSQLLGPGISGTRVETEHLARKFRSAGLPCVTQPG